MEVKDGTYAITEQGDLGLGLTPVNEDAIEQKDEKEDKNDPFIK